MAAWVVIMAAIAAVSSLFATPLTRDPVDAAKPRPIARGVLATSLVLGFAGIVYLAAAP